MSSYQQLKYLKEAAARSINGAFQTFLSNEISIPKWTRSLASESQIHLREFLVDESKKDITFPRILQSEDCDFIGGSFARHTKVKPLDDIDIYFPLDGYNLQVVKDGIIQPIKVISDNVLDNNPILNPEWMVGNYVSSYNIINGFFERLKRHYPDSVIKLDGQAVSVQFKKGSTDPSGDDGIGFDIVPCFHLVPHDGSQDYYFIPDGKNGWISSNPRLDTKISEYLNDFSDTYRKVVRLIKYWNDQQYESRMKSYYIELAVAEIYIRYSREGKKINSISEGFELGFKHLSTCLYYGQLGPPLKIAPLVSASDNQIIDYLKTQEVLKLIKNARCWEQMGREQNAIDEWRKVFGPSFPSSQ